MRLIHALSVVLILGFGSAPASADLSNCALCHKPGGPAPAPPAGLYASAHADLACVDCHTNARAPHKGTAVTLDCGTCHQRERGLLASSAHAPGVAGGPTCAKCHRGGHGVKPLPYKEFEPRYAPAVCVSCHEGETAKYLKSAHGLASTAGGAGAPGCEYCHESAHSVKPVAASPRLAAANELRFCGECHAGKALTAAPPYAMPDPERQLLAGVHGRVNPATGRINVNCSDCHGPHDEQPAWAPTSAVNPRNLPATCGRCHPRELGLYRRSVHYTIAAAGVNESPTCETCHGGHNIVAVLGATGPGDRWAANVSLCSGCHVSPALAAKFNMRTDPAADFEKTYHGVVHAGGKRTAADCGSCHHVHDVLPSSDPRSSVYAGNLPRTCGVCHPGKGDRFYRTEIHVPLTGALREPTRIVAIIYIALIALILGGMMGHNALDYVVKVRAARRRELAASPAVTRLSPLERLQHVLLLASFALLGYTGFAIKFPSAWFAAWFVKLEGAHSWRVATHKGAAATLLALSVLHVGYLVLTRRGRARLRAIWPRPRDVRETAHAVLHKLGVVKEAPRFGEFNYAEKAEYWALVWGIAIMGLTGLYMWLEPHIYRHFPFWLYQVLRAIHFYEAVLAVSAIIVWHLYAVIFDPAVYPMNFAWLDGKMTRAVLRHEKPAYLEEIEEEEKAGADGEEGNGEGPDERPAAGA